MSAECTERTADQHFVLEFSCDTFVSWTQTYANFGHPRHPNASGLLFQIGEHETTDGPPVRLGEVFIKYEEGKQLRLLGSHFAWMDIFTSAQNVSPLSPTDVAAWLWPDPHAPPTNRGRKIHCRSCVKHLVTFWPDGWRADASVPSHCGHRRLVFSSDEDMTLTYQVQFGPVHTLARVTSILFKDSDKPDHGAKQDPPWPG